MTGKTYENRTYLRWDEAAKTLGMDREGLRQALLDDFKPQGRTVGGRWLPVVLTSRGEGYLTSLQFDSWTKKPSFRWADRDSYHQNCDGQNLLTFADGTDLPLRGESGADYWEAAPNYGTGLPFTFVVGGRTLAIRPESVRHACDHDGYFDSVDIAPRDWCNEGFPLEFFHVVERAGSMFQKKPVSLFDEGQFLANDVMRLRAELFGCPESATTRRVEPSKDRPLRADTRENLLRVIRVLYGKANWPEREAVGEILQLLQSHGFNGPSDDTIRKFLDEARSLEPDFASK